VIVQVFKDRLTEAFPESAWVPLATGLREGIGLADRVIEDTPLLRFITGLDLRGHIRRAAVLFRLWELCRTGTLPFQAEAAKMPVGCWHWLDIDAADLVAHVIRTDFATQIPEITSNRQPEYLKNEYDLYKDGRIPPVETLFSDSQQSYSTITFGATRKGELTHARIGIPSSDGSEWLASIDLLRRGKPGAEPVVPPAPPPPDPTQMLRFRKRVEEASAEQNKQKDEKSA